jgi:hypothetical protein
MYKNTERPNLVLTTDKGKVQPTVCSVNTENVAHKLRNAKDGDDSNPKWRCGHEMW